MVFKLNIVMIIFVVSCTCCIALVRTLGEDVQFGVSILHPDPLAGAITLQCTDDITLQNETYIWLSCGGCDSSGSHAIDYTNTRYIHDTNLEILSKDLHSHTLHLKSLRPNVTTTIMCHLKNEKLTRRVFQIPSQDQSAPGDFLARSDQMIQMCPVISSYQLVLSCRAACPTPTDCEYFWKRDGDIYSSQLDVTKIGEYTCVDSRYNTSILKFHVVHGSSGEQPIHAAFCAHRPLADGPPTVPSPPLTVSMVTGSVPPTVSMTTGSDPGVKADTQQEKNVGGIVAGVLFVVVGCLVLGALAVVLIKKKKRCKGTSDDVKGVRNVESSNASCKDDLLSVNESGDHRMPPDDPTCCACVCLVGDYPQVSHDEAECS